VATVGGVGLSIPRQVGKTYFVLAMLVILCILFPGMQVVWTAHHLRTSTKTFTTLRGICRRKKVAPHVRAMRAANGEQQVEFTNGSMIMFGARSRASVAWLRRDRRRGVRRGADPRHQGA
jgi:hypothetical protein